MEINGKHYHDPRIQLKELKLAVDRSPFDEPLRPHFDFLFGYIDVLQERDDQSEADREKVDHLDAAMDEAKESIDSALRELGEDAPDDFTKALESLIEYAKSAEEIPTAAVTQLNELLAATP